MTSVLPLTWRQKGLEKLGIDMDGILSRILNLNELQIIWYSVQTRPECGFQSDRHSSSGQGLNHPLFHCSHLQVHDIITQHFWHCSHETTSKNFDSTIYCLYYANRWPILKGKKCIDHTLAHCHLSLKTTPCFYLYKSSVLYWLRSFIYIRADSYELCLSLPSVYYYQHGYRTVIHPSVQTSFLHHDYC